MGESAFASLATAFSSVGATWPCGSSSRIDQKISSSSFWATTPKFKASSQWDPLDRARRAQLALCRASLTPRTAAGVVLWPACYRPSGAEDEWDLVPGAHAPGYMLAPSGAATGRDLGSNGVFALRPAEERSQVPGRSLTPRTAARGRAVPVEVLTSRRVQSARASSIWAARRKSAKAASASRWTFSPSKIHTISPASSSPVRCGPLQVERRQLQAHQGIVVGDLPG